MQPHLPAMPGWQLDYEVARWVHNGWAVESRTPTMAVFVSGKPVNHILHLLLTLFTCFLWGFVWLLLTLTTQVKRATIVLNPDGTISQL